MGRQYNKNQPRNKSKSMDRYKQQPQLEEQTQKTQQLDKKTLLALKSDDQLTKMRQFYEQILLEPEAHFKHVDAIFIFAKAANVKVSTTALRLLAEIFVGTAPLEAVDMKQIEERTGIKITRDQFKVLKFQELLVNQYERYLKMLKELNSKLNASSFGSDEQLFLEFKKCILHCLVRCYNSLWNFNHFKLLNEVMLRFVKYQECRTVLQTYLSDKNIATLKIKSKIISGIAALLKEKPENSLPDDLIKIVNSTHINTDYLNKDAEVLKFKKKKLSKKLYRQQQLEKKKEKQAYRQKKAQGATLQKKKKIKDQKVQQKMKVRQQVNKQFAEGQATISNKQLVKNNSAILQQIFYIYFKLLIQRVNSKYVRDCLDGILAFAHLINIDLISNLITHLDSSAHYFRQLWQHGRNQHVLENRLLIIFTSESLLNGPLSVYNMDDLKVTTNLFKILRDINQQKVSLTRQHFRLIAMTLQEALLKRRQLSQQIVGSFVRQISLLLLKQQIPKFYLLQLLRQISSKYNRVSRMFQEDNQGYGLNSFNDHCEDPQCTNAIHTQILTNLKALAKLATKKKQLKQVGELVDRLIRQNFNRVQNSSSIAEILDRDLTLVQYKIY